MRIPNLFSRLDVGRRIYAGFASVLVALAAVAFIGNNGLNASREAFDVYATITDDTLRIQRIEGEMTALRENVLAFATSGRTEHADAVRADAAAIAADLGAAIEAAADEAERRGQLEALSGLLSGYTMTFDRLVALREQRDALVRDEMNPRGAAISNELYKIAEAAMATGDMEDAAYAGAAQQELLLGRLEAIRFLSNPDARTAEAARAHFTRFGSSATALLGRLYEQDRIDRAKAAHDLAPKYLAAFATVADLTTQMDELVTLVMTQQANEFTARSAATVEAQNGALAAIRENAGADIRATVSLNLAASFAAVLIGIACAVLIARGITRPVRRMTDAMSRLAEGDKSTEIPGMERRDEIGTMARAVGVFKDNMIEADRLRAEQEEGKRRAEADRRAEMLRLADAFERSVGGIVGSVASAATEMQGAAAAMSATAEETSRQATTVAAASGQATANVQTVAAATEELNASISEIGRQVAQSAQSASQAVAEAERTDESVEFLNRAAAKIGDVVELISSIAAQTNLLALNATIEAARAGEAGKGFAVVASEVKSLATQTARATEEIRSQIDEMQHATGQAVGAIRGIGRTIKGINETAAMIAAAVEQQGAATQEISGNVAQAAQGTEEVSQNIAGVTQASAEVGSAATQVLQAAGELSQQSEQLRGEVDRFLATVRAA